MVRPVITEWRDATGEEVGAAAKENRVAVLPVGAVEQHGPHLATGTDVILAEHAARAACARTQDIVLPSLAVGCSLGHTDKWPGTLSLSPSTMLQVVLETGRWLHASGFRKLLMLNAHATNGPPCQSALLQLRYEFPDLRMRFVSMFDLTPAIAARYREDADDFHANEAETSLMAHLHPRGVRLERAADESDRTDGLVWQYAMPAVSRSGVVGTPTAASAARGRELFAQVVDALVDLLTRARSEPVDPLA